MVTKMQNKYIAPSYRITQFHCPSCKVYAHQEWVYAKDERGELVADLQVARCSHCENYSLWVDEDMIFPRESNAPIAHEDMPQEAEEIYNEAREVSSMSPRAAAALLRVALEKLVVSLGETEGTLNSRIGNLSKKGLPQEVIKSLDIVRITANEGGSHAGEIDLTGSDNERIVN